MTSSIPAPEGSPEDLLAQRPSGIQGPPAASAPRTRPGLTAVLGAVVVAALLFAGGLVVGHATSASAATATGRGGPGLAGGRFGAGGAREGAPGAPGAQGGFAGGGFTSGDITAISGTTVTIKAPDGTTTTVTTTPSTTVAKTVTTDLSGLKVGDRITVIGQKDSSGNLAARAITEGTGGFGGARGGAVPAPTN